MIKNVHNFKNNPYFIIFILFKNQFDYTLEYIIADSTKNNLNKYLLFIKSNFFVLSRLNC